jgi:hypothetical protein
MKARQLIRDSALGPETLNAVFQAFDGAWGQIAQQFGNDAVAIETARVRLATIVLGLAKDTRDPAQLQDSAVKIFCTERRP